MIVCLIYLLFFAASSEAVKTIPASFPKGLLVDGKNVSIEEVPYQAIIYYDRRPICGGVIISGEQILTSAHCFSNYAYSPNSYHVRAGSSSRSMTEGQNLYVKDVKKHNSFSGTYDPLGTEFQIPVNDLAMIITTYPIDFDAKIKPIQLFNEAEAVQANKDGLITGWRKINGTEQLTTREVHILDNDYCSRIYQKVGVGVSAGQICASYSGPRDKEACLGDSGSPLVVEGRLAGILSWGNGCVKSQYPGVYTAISFYRDWIDNGGEDLYRLEE